MDLIRCFLARLERYQVLAGFTGFYWVLLGFVWVLPGYTGLYWVFTDF